ncbi:MAG: DUF6427 family protein [Bacteroidales bacterium]|nr:DUF6427 family protein [Bacteroidales bacterium]
MMLWLPAIIHPPLMPAPEGPVILYSVLYDIFSGTPLLSVILGFILACWETYFFTRLLNKNELIVKNSSLASLIFLILLSIFPDQLTLTPLLPALFFILFVLHHLLIIYSKPEHFDRVFAAGFFTALASLFYLPVLIWFGFIIVSFLLFRSGKWREWIASTIGLLTPYIYLAIYYFWNDEFLLKAHEYSDFFRQLKFGPRCLDPGFWVPEGVILVLTIWGLIKNRRGIMERTVELRAKYSLFIWLLLFSGLTLVYARSLITSNMMLATPAFALIISSAMTGLKKTRLIELVLILLFIGLLINNFIIQPFSVS